MSHHLFFHPGPTLLYWFFFSLHSLQRSILLSCHFLNRPTKVDCKISALGIFFFCRKTYIMNWPCIEIFCKLLLPEIFKSVIFWVFFSYMFALTGFHQFSVSRNVVSSSHVIRDLRLMHAAIRGGQVGTFWLLTSERLLQHFLVIVRDCGDFYFWTQPWTYPGSFHNPIKFKFFNVV